MKFVSLFSTFLLLFSGCAKYTPAPKHEIVLPENFSLQGRGELQQEWWKTFNDPSLNELMQTALLDNLSLKASWQRLQQSMALVKKSSVALYPDLSFSNTVSALENIHTKSYTTGVAASYELDLWGRFDALRDASMFELQASKENLIAAYISLSAEVATAWYRLQEQHLHAKLLQNQIALNEKHLELIERKFRSAQAKASDVLQQKQTLESVRSETILTKGRIELFKNQLALLLGKNRSMIDFKVAANFPNELFIPTLDVPTELLMHRPDVKASYYKLQAMDRKVADTVAKQYPKLSLSITLNNMSRSSSDIFSNWLLNLASNVTMPLFDAGLRKAEVERSSAQRNEHLYLYAQTLLSAYKEVEDALSRVVHQKEYLVSINEQVKLSASSLKQIKDQYIHANATYLSFLNAQLAHERLQRTQISASRELMEYTISLYRSISTGWKIEKLQRDKNGK